MAENVYVTASAVFYGHAGFEIDWGNDAGGMQTGRGHRVNIHNAALREIGAGLIGLEYLAMLLVLSLLYGLLYLILRLEDYALLAGAVAGFVMLTIVMFSTLKVDWSGEKARAG